MSVKAVKISEQELEIRPYIMDGWSVGVMDYAYALPGSLPHGPPQYPHFYCVENDEIMGFGWKLWYFYTEDFVPLRQNWVFCGDYKVANFSAKATEN